jgi:hypothetical protein
VALRSKTITIQLSNDTREAFVNLDNDIQALVGMVDELVATHTSILATIKEKIAIRVQNDGGNGIEASDIFPEPESGEDQEKRVRSGPKPGVPDSMQTGHLKLDSQAIASDDPDRIRATPFTRAPRHTQVKWLKEYMADGRWYAAIVIARDVANDERHYRYLRSALGNRLREMHEESLVQRRSSQVKGSMFEYRLPPAVPDGQEEDTE